MILIPVILLIGMGLLMVYSASSHIAEHRFGDSNFYLKRQILFCAIGIAAMLITRYIPCTLYQKLVYPLLALSALLLVLLFVPGLGRKVGGAYRWMNVAGFSFQPSEMVKFSLAVYLAYSMSKKGSDLELFTKGLLPHLLVVGTFMVLIYLQPDLGTAVIIGTWTLVLLFVGGVRVLQLFGLFYTCSTCFRLSGLECRLQGQEVARFPESLGRSKGDRFSNHTLFSGIRFGGNFRGRPGQQQTETFLSARTPYGFRLVHHGGRAGFYRRIRHYCAVRGSDHGRHTRRPQQQRSLQQLSGPRVDLLSGPSGDCQYGSGSGIIAHKRAHPSPYQLWGFIPGNDPGGYRCSAEHFFEELN
jgi:cell division protein FtsW (lipid II flippase)